jgi:REP element-mobilizing transposase RayT
VLIHLVFSTKNREPLIPAALHGALHADIGAVLNHVECRSLRVGGPDDHVHILYALARTRALATVTEKVKTASSTWMKQRGATAFAWQTGYGGSPFPKPTPGRCAGTSSTKRRSMRG